VGSKEGSGQQKAAITIHDPIALANRVKFLEELIETQAKEYDGVLIGLRHVVSDLAREKLASELHFEERIKSMEQK
jgi:hypothetical protein